MPIFLRPQIYVPAPLEPTIKRRGQVFPDSGGTRRRAPPGIRVDWLACTHADTPVLRANQLQTNRQTTANKLQANRQPICKPIADQTGRKVDLARRVRPKQFRGARLAYAQNRHQLRTAGLAVCRTMRIVLWQRGHFFDVYHRQSLSL